MRCTTFMHPSQSVHGDRSSGCPPSPPCSCPITDSLMLHCQQHLSKLVAAAPRDGELTLPMFTRISNIAPKAKAAAAAWLDSGLERARQPSFGSLCSSSDDELEQCESPAVDVWQPDPLLADDLMEDLDAGFWQAQEDLLSQEELLSALGGGLSEGFDPCLAKHACTRRSGASLPMHLDRRVRHFRLPARRASQPSTQPGYRLYL